MNTAPSTPSAATAINNNNSNEDDSALKTNKGRLRMTILSAYDLPDREPPLCIKLEITGEKNQGLSVQTGPPVQRHKNRNSFKFHSHKANITSNGELVIETTNLADLYQETAILTVVYANPLKTVYTASYPLNQLLIHETTWLILNLTPSGAEGAQIPEQTSSIFKNRQQEQQRALMTNASMDSRTPNVDVVDDDDDEVPPTLRLQMKLDGPYRTEIGALLELVKAWLALVEDVETKIHKDVVPYLPTIPLNYLLIPTAPIVALLVVSAPILIGVTLITLPLVLPAFVVACVVGTCVMACAAILYASTKAGRVQVGGWLSPLQHTLLNTQTGQAWVYQTGPRPTPVHLCRTLFPTGIWGKLFVSLWIDFIGSASYLLPILGEALDVFWAPLQTAFVMALYCPDEETGPATAMLPYVSFVEEILPLTDIVPTATLGWFGQFAWPVIMEQLGHSKIPSHSSGVPPVVPGSSLRVTLSNP